MSTPDVTPVHAPLSALLDGTPVHAPLSALLGTRPAERVGDRIGDRLGDRIGDRRIRAIGTGQRPAELPQLPQLAVIPAVARAAIAPAIAPAHPPLIAPAPTENVAPVAISTPAAAPAAAPYAIGGLAIAMIGSIGFSGKAIIVKVAYRYGVDAVTLIMYRMLVALLPFLVIAWWSGRGKPPLSWRDRGSICILGVTGYYLASYLDFVGLQYISASLERLILYLNPTLVFAFGLLWFGQRATRRQVVAIATGYAGMLVVFGSEISFVGDNVVLGTALVFAGAVSYALYISYSGALVKRIGSLRLVGWASTVACLLCFAQFLLLRPLSAALVPAPVIWLSLLNGTACTVAPVLLLMIAIQRVGATTAAQASLLGPISTIAMSIFILGEPFTPWVAVGTVLVIGSISMLARKPAIAR